jgi:hypothetical protein
MVGSSQKPNDELWTIWRRKALKSLAIIFFTIFFFFLLDVYFFIFFITLVDLNSSVWFKQL